MAAINASLSQGCAGGYTNPHVSADLSTLNFIGWPPGTPMDMGTAPIVTMAHVVAAAHPVSINGASAHSYADDWYDRIHVIPDSIALGNLVQAQQRMAYVWNAWRTQSLTLDALDEVATDGMTITGEGALPLVFAPMQMRAWTIAVDTAGPAAIDATLTWVFASGEQPSMTVTGQRLAAWVFMPDWSGGIVETMEWLTDVQTAWQGAEYREPVRDAPRRSWEFQLILAGAERQLAEGMLFAWRARNWALPVWPDQSQLAASLAAGSTSIPLDTANLDYAIGDVAMLWRSPTQYELAEVSAIAADTLTLARATTQDWAAGTLVYPCRVARLTDTPTLTRKSSDVVTSQVRFEAAEPCDWPAAAPAATYLGYPVLEDRNEESDDPTADYDRTIDTLDNTIGLPEVTDRTGLAFPTQSQAWLLQGRAARGAHRSLLYWLQGRAEALWLPSWSDDLTLAKLAGSSDTTITVVFAGVALYLAGDDARKHVRMELVDGTVFYRAVASAVDLGDGTEQLAIDSGLGQTVEPTQVRQISWLALSRLAGDSVQIQHDTDSEGVAHCAANFVAVPAEEPA